jgi:hypothetical protein
VVTQIDEQKNRAGKYFQVYGCPENLLPRDPGDDAAQAMR